MTSARTKTETTRSGLRQADHYASSSHACCKLYLTKLSRWLKNRILKILFESANIYSNCTGNKIEINRFSFLVTCECLVHNTRGLKNLFVTEGITYLNIAFPVSLDHTEVTHSGHRKLVSCNCELQICEACRL